MFKGSSPKQPYRSIFEEQKEQIDSLRKRAAENLDAMTREATMRLKVQGRYEELSERIAESKKQTRNVVKGLISCFSHVE